MPELQGPPDFDSAGLEAVSQEFLWHPALCGFSIFVHSSGGYITGKGPFSRPSNSTPFSISSTYPTLLSTKPFCQSCAGLLGLLWEYLRSHHHLYSPETMISSEPSRHWMTTIANCQVCFHSCSAAHLPVIFHRTARMIFQAYKLDYVTTLLLIFQWLKRKFGFPTMFCKTPHHLIPSTPDLRCTSLAHSLFPSFLCAPGYLQALSCLTAFVPTTTSSLSGHFPPFGLLLIITSLEFSPDQQILFLVTGNILFMSLIIPITK